MRYIYILLVFVLCLGCKNKHEIKTLEGKEIIDAAIKVAGDSIFNSSVITFKFRDKLYRAERNEGLFSLNREFSQDSQFVTDVLNNKGFKRYINKQPLVLTDSMATAYAASVNSVHYFSVLPYGLQNKAVKPKNLGIENIGEEQYFKIKVTFNKEGGGEDYEDVFMYWFKVDDFKLTYLAYSYEEESEVGMRFREGYNERYISGIRFLDYKNYKPKINIPIEELAKAHKEGQLELVSDIKLEEVSVILIDE